MTGGRGPDACIDAVGMEAHGTDVMGVIDTVKQATKVRDRAALCFKAGDRSLP